LAEGRDPKRAERSGALVERALTQIYHSSLVTIACVQGAAVAGGAGLMSACDFVLAAPGSKIGYPETRRGLVAGLVMTFLKRQLRERDVRELLLLAELISAERAQEMGLINAVVEERQLLENAVDYAQKVAQNAPAATTMTKELLDQMYGRPVKMDLETAHSYHLKMRGTAEAQEGMQAFIEKRSPAWVVH
jgi:methylglutaconyl-CoA hydratase